jgi:hypothetical protein
MTTTSVVIVWPSGVLPVDVVTSPVRPVDLAEDLDLREQLVAVRAPDRLLLASDAQVHLDLDDAGLFVEDAEPDLLLLGVGVRVEHLLGGGRQLAAHRQADGVGFIRHCSRLSVECFRG